MSNNYIEIDNKIAKIHKDGKVCTLKNPNNVKILLDICHKHNIYFKSNKGIIRNADKIIREFDLYHSNKNKKKQKLEIAPENLIKLAKGSKLMRMNPIGKAIIATGLASVIGFTSMGINSIRKAQVSANTYESQATIEEVPEYVNDDSIPVINEDIVQFNASNEDGVIIQEGPKMLLDSDLVKMLQESDEFHFSYSDRTNEDSLANAKRYEDLFIKYGNRYGVDPALLMAMAAQESAGNHYDNLGGRYGNGIMQIEKSVHLNTTVKAYNFETGEMESVKITESAIEDLETNIQIGTIIFRNNLEANNYNIPITLQSYNFGPGNMSKVLNACSESEGITKNDIKNDATSSIWLNYRSTVSAGDPQYVEHVFSYIENGTVLTVKDRDGNDIRIQVINDQVNTNKLQ